MKKNARIYHKWIGIISCFFIIVVSLTAILLNHKSFYVTKKSETFDIQQATVLTSNPFNYKNLVASDLKGLYKSEDNGKTWKPLELFVPAKKINNIVFDPYKKDTLIVTLREVGLYISDDNGEIWDEIKLPFSPNEGEYIENLALAKDTIQIKTRFGFYTYNQVTEKWNNLNFDNNKKESILTFEELVYKLHTGRIFEDFGVFISDGICLSLIFLSISGIILSLRIKKVTHAKT